MSQTATHPLVSCIMPTLDRPEFVPQAIRYFLRQDYEARELIIVDDGSHPVDNLIPDDERIRYIRLHEKVSVGAKRNLACEHARGEIIAHWDDDDWYAPHRLRYQVRTILSDGSDVCGIKEVFFYDIERGEAWQYIYPSDRKLWLSGSTLCYTRDFWKVNNFANIDVGEDACFMWTERPKRVSVLPDPSFHVGIIHRRNVSPKETDNHCWRPLDVDEIRQIVSSDWDFYDHTNQRGEPALTPLPVAASGSEKPLRNVYACLVHERQECVVDLLRNLRYHDPSSDIILYNGSRNAQLLNHGFPFERYGAVLHPSPRPMSWGWLHGFALDCMQFALDNLEFDTLTIVDSDQLGVRSGYTRLLSQSLSSHTNVGMLGNCPMPLSSDTTIAPAAQAWKEFKLWRSFLQRFEQGEEKFVHWTFWPSTVFMVDAARDLTRLFASDEHLQEIMRRSRVWATEEVVLPTLVALLGYKIAANPCSYEYVRYRVPYTMDHIEYALSQPDVFWVHPVPRQYFNSIRKHIRRRFNEYEKSSGPSAPPVTAEPGPEPELLLTLPILARMRGIEGWLEDEEADLLIAVALRALTALHDARAIVEVGSYCGRSTVVLGSVIKAFRSETRIYAIDPHDGRVGAMDQEISAGPSTLDRFLRNISDAGLEGVVETVEKYSYEVAWDEPISLLFIDGLHDYASVSRDFFHFEEWVVPGGYIAFHDYADYYPGVQAFVNEILGFGKYRKVRCEKTLMVVEKL